MRRAWPTALVLLVCLLGAVVFFGMVKSGQVWRCQSDPHLVFCEQSR